MGRCQRSGIKPKFQRPRSSLVVHQDVRPADEPGEFTSALGRVKVEADATLVDVEREVGAALLGIFDVVGEWAPPPRRVARRGFHLDDVGTVVA